MKKKNAKLRFFSTWKIQMNEIKMCAQKFPIKGKEEKMKWKCQKKLSVFVSCKRCESYLRIPNGNNKIFEEIKFVDMDSTLKQNKTPNSAHSPRHNQSRNKSELQNSKGKCWQPTNESIGRELLKSTEWFWGALQLFKMAGIANFQ